jgi:hypothetical protein
MMDDDRGPTARLMPVWRVSVDDAAARRVVVAYKDDRPIEEIVSRFGISRATLYQLLDVEGIPLRCEGRGRKPNTDPEKERAIIEAHRAKVSMSEIRRRFGIGWNTYRAVLAKNGIALLPGSGNR